MFVAETKAEEVCVSTGEEEDVSAVNDKRVSGGESEECVDKEESNEASLATLAVTTEPTDKSRGVSLSRLRHVPRVGAEPPLESATNKPLALAVDWRPSEDVGIGVGETVFAAWTLEDDPDGTVVVVVA
ncbi:hypothetical protein GN958_ATG02267 [Phytophthora infestans]|uniref:Uncharacterized protein n=1 Tax=Phytophthora infestans TaxID=4787 RepID=A0A8S9V7K3_PHYIN|nr:hypothetical protein GN958_ATG02267 [Phytophthora infestans]